MLPQLNGRFSKQHIQDMNWTRFAPSPPARHSGTNGTGVECRDARTIAVLGRKNGNTDQHKWVPGFRIYVQRLGLNDWDTMIGFICRETTGANNERGSYFLLACFPADIFLMRRSRSEALNSMANFSTFSYTTGKTLGLPLRPPVGTYLRTAAGVPFAGRPLGLPEAATTFEGRPIGFGA